MTSNIKPNILSLVLSLISFAVTIVFSACDYDFTEEERIPPHHYSTDTIIIHSEMNLTTANLNFGVANKKWKIILYPNIIEPNEKSGIISSTSSLSLPLVVNKESNYGKFPSGFLNFELVVEVNDIGLFHFPIQYFSYEDPKISITPQTIEVWDNSSGEIDMDNKSNGILNWRITKTPEWMTVVNASGQLQPYSSKKLTYNSSTEELAPGTYESEIIISSNAQPDIHIPVKLIVGSFSANNKYQDGVLIDCKYLSRVNQLIAVTTLPNRISIFTDGKKYPTIIPLVRVPRCIALSDDEKTLAIGYSNAEISTYDTESFTQKSTYLLKAIPNALAYGSNNFLYFLTDYSSNPDYKYLNCLNLTSRESVRSNKYEGGIKALKKIPNQNIIITTKPRWSPEGLFMYYFTDQGTVDSLNAYWITPYSLWPSDTGDRILTGSRIAYRVPEFTPNSNYYLSSDPPLAGTFELTASGYVDAIATQSAKGLLYVASASYSESGKTIIQIFDDQTYAQLQVHKLSSQLPAGHSPLFTWWEKTIDLFPSSNGAKLWIIQKYPSQGKSSSDYWGIRHLDLN
jgi:hypothetical protein